MKMRNFGLAGLCLLALGAQAQTETVTAAMPAAATTAAPLAVKIGYTNVQYLLSASPQTKIIKSQLETAGKQYEKAIQDKMKDLEDKFAIYQKNEGTMMESIKADKQNELRSLETSIRTLQESAQGELKQKETELVKPELDKIYEGINTVAKENAYTVILQGDALLYGNETMDVTDLVLKKLGYPKPKEEADEPKAAKAPAAEKAAPAAPGKPAPPSPKKKK